MTGPTVGSQVSHYRLERVLGAGGMGQVFLARDLTLDRPVAIKFLIATQDESARRRLLAEARSAAALDHPSICTVHEVVTDDVAGDFIVMTYVEGETLGSRLKRGRLSPTQTMAIMVPLLQALGTAHRAGVVHRDVKPHNIVLTPTGLPKLLDFGIARRILPESSSSEDATTASQVTGDGDIVGTLAYMSPEQVQGQPVDARSDLFSLGSVIYECLTGLRAFAGASRAETIGQLLHVDPPAPSSVVADLSPTFDALCADLLRKVPTERFQSADEVLGAIRGTSPTQRLSAPAVRSARSRQFSRRQWTMVAAGVVVAAGLGITWALSGGTSLPEPAPGALDWFKTGVDKLREGSYTGARTALEEAVKISPDFIQARLRLAEAMSELEDVDGAREVLLKAQEALPANARLKHDDQLRLEAVRSSVLRNHDGAISAYRQLADRAPREAAAWLDVGRAEEAAGLRVAAMQHYEQAVKLDGQSAAAHQRLGVLQSQGGLRDLALKSLGEAIRLHHVNSNLEGEAEATLRKATVHIALQDWAAASAAVGRVVEIAKNPDFVSLRLRAQFELARVAQLEGRFEEAEKLFSDALHEAISNEMGTIAADGLRGLATLLTFAGRLDDADAQLVQAINIAVKLKASRAEAQARLQQASLRLAQDRHADAIALVEAPLRFVTKEKYVRNEAEAKSILARAHESLEHYDEAHQLASEVLKVAESLEDPVLTGLALDNLAGQAERLGQLVEALTLRERLEKLHRDRNDHSNLAFDLVNRADLLIRLGRGADAEVALADVERAAAEGRQDYKNRLPTVSLMRALRASIEGRYGEVVALARAAEGSVTAKPSDNALLARLLAEHALARLGRSRIDVNEIAAWPAQASEPALSREMTYWAARTLIERRSDELARKICQEAWGAAPARTNLELRWRLAALVGQAAAATTGASDQASSATMRTSARDELQKLLGQWVGQGVAYIARPDLAALRKGLS